MFFVIVNRQNILVGNDLQSQFSFIPLMTGLHLRVHDIDVVRRELLSIAPNINLLNLFGNTLMSPSELMLIVSILFAEIKSMPVYQRLIDDAQQLECNDIFRTNTTEDEIREMFENELEACTLELRRLTVE